MPQTFQCPGGNWGQPLRCGEVLAQAEEPSGGPDLPAARLRVVRIPEIELRWWDGCPSTDRALAELQEILDSLDLSDVEVRMTEISNDEEARAVRFPGSPTILVDGEDVAAPGPEDYASSRLCPCGRPATDRRNARERAGRLHQSAPCDV